MSRLGIAAAALALALLTFFQFPGHTWLQQDSQIYIPVLENQYDSSILRNDILVQQSHVAYTLYDEVAVLLRRITGLGFREILAFQQIVTRALGIWGFYLIAQALGLAMAPAIVLTLIVSLGARIPGPEVLTFEYEPTPRAFALPLLYCAIGLAAHRRYMEASIAAGVAFLYHFPAAAPFWLLFAAILVLRRTYLPLVPLAAATVILLAASRVQGGGLGLLSHIAPMQEQLQRMRAAYVWISLWPGRTILYHLVVAAIAAGAYLRLRSHIPFKLRLLIPGLGAIGLLSMPLSWLLLEHWKLSLAPQIQPMRWLLFVTLAMQLLTAAAAVYAAGRGRWWEAILWFAAAYLAPLQPMGSSSQLGRRIAVVLALAACTALAKRFAPVVALIAFFLVPTVGRIVNYPQLHTPELTELSGWARDAAPRNAVFLFADAGSGLQPGIFRSEALLAVYVDWKGGGQVNYLKEFADQWWFRWQQTMAKGFKPEDLPKYQALGIQYVVVGPQNALPQGPLFENGRYRVYRIGK